MRKYLAWCIITNSAMERCAVFVLGVLGLFFVDSVAGCGHGWAPFETRCYFNSHRLTLNWFDAKSFCAEFGATLVAPKNRKENQFLYNMGRQTGHVCTWLGISDLRHEGQWLKYPNLDYAYFTNFKGQPDNYKGTEHCAGILTALTSLWNDYQCEYNCNFICVK